MASLSGNRFARFADYDDHEDVYDPESPFGANKPMPAIVRKDEAIYESAKKKMKDVTREYKQESCFIVCDPWAPGLLLGDIDDWLCMINACKTVRYPVFYINSDIPGRYASVEASGFIDMLRRINPNAVFLHNESSEDELRTYLGTPAGGAEAAAGGGAEAATGGKDILIQARIAKGDNKLKVVFDRIMSYKGRKVWAQGVGPYNFEVIREPVSLYANLNDFGEKEADVEQFESNLLNRRLSQGQLKSLFLDPNVPIDVSEKFSKLAIAYGLAKNIFLPVLTITPGFLIDRGKPGRLANNQKKNLEISNIFTQSGENANQALLRYINKNFPRYTVVGESGHTENRGRNNEWVNSFISRVDQKVFEEMKIPDLPLDEQHDFYEGYAFTIYKFEQLSGKGIKDYNDKLPDLSMLGRPDSTGKILMLEMLGTSSSPLWDAFFQGAWANNFRPKDIAFLEGKVDLFQPATPFMVALIDVDSLLSNGATSQMIIDEATLKLQGRMGAGRKRRKTKRKAIRKSSNRSVRRQSTRKRKTYKRR